MQNPEGVPAVRPHQQQCIFSLCHFRQGFLHVARALDLAAIDFEDDVSLLQSGVVGWASRLHLLDHGSVNLARSLKLIAQFGRQVAEVATAMSRTREVIDPRPDRIDQFRSSYSRLVDELEHRGWLPSPESSELGFLWLSLLKDWFTANWMLKTLSMLL